MKILFFSSPTCSKCHTVQKQLDLVCTEANLTYEHVDISTDDGYKLAEQYSVSAVPTIMILSDEGKEEGGFSGNVVFAKQIKELLGIA